MKPELRPISRRRFVQYASLGAAAAVAGAGGVLTVFHTRSNGPLDGSVVPIQNPAFSVAAGETEGHVVLFCQVGVGTTKDFLAFDLNGTAAAIWGMCACGVPSSGASSRTLDEIAAALSSHAEAADVTGFVSLMRDKGLVYLADSESRVFWEYEDVH